MCGIAGILAPDNRPIPKDLLHRMNVVQAHRGPDGDGYFFDPGIGLAHRRLAVIDPGSGKQPMFNEDGSVTVVYNGEIYNYAELRSRLLEQGHQFRTDSDTEVIVHAWESWGEQCVELFNGMFSIALWDRNQKTLFLARDRLGIKPLHYSWLPDGRLVFASELKALLSHPDLPRTLSPEAVEDYFAYGYVPDPKTILHNVYKLPAGSRMRVPQGGRGQPQSYWDVPFALDERPLDSAMEELDGLLSRAVSRCMVADVPIGAFLSGGVDSSAVAATMAGLSDRPINTCSIGFSDPRFDESQYAQQVASHIGSRHWNETVSEQDLALVANLAAIYDEPYADSSALATYRLSELARRHVTVALSGDGGDENFAGYPRYRAHRTHAQLRRLLPASLRRPLFGALAALYPKADWAPRPLRAKATFQALAMQAADAMAHTAMLTSSARRHRLYCTGFHRQLNGYHAREVFRDQARTAPTDDPVGLSQYMDLKIYLPGDILTKVDRASMAHSLEVRVPVLDHELVEWASSLPTPHKLRGREGKYLFKQMLQRHLPTGVLYRKKKGFDVPVSRWFRGPLLDRARDLASNSPMLDLGIFDRRFLRTLVEEHARGTRDNGSVLWSLMQFDGFVRLHLMGTPWTQPELSREQSA